MLRLQGMSPLPLLYSNVVNAVTSDLCSGFKILWYQIESVLGRGGFGITYLARDENLGQLVAIKEYLPFAFAARSGDSTVQPIHLEKQGIFSLGLKRFMNEAQMLAKFKHPNIVRVLSVFKHNNTGYMVMEYEQGETLSDVYKRKKKLKQHELEDIFYPIIDGLSSVHKAGFIHRDIKPSNIYIRSDSSPVLIDFGAARQAIDSVPESLTSMFSVGYTPFEQYHQSSDKQGPWTDIYALCATIYQGITGEKPQESTIRGMALLHQESDPYKPLSKLGIKSYTPAFLQTIDRALMLRIYDRPQTLDDFLGMLKGDIGLPSLPSILPADYVPVDIGNRRVTVLDRQKNADDDTQLELAEEPPDPEPVVLEYFGDDTQLDLTGLLTDDEADEVEGPGDDAEPDQTEYQTFHERDKVESSGDYVNQHTTAEAIAYTCKDQTHIAHAEATSEHTLPLRRFARERLKRSEVRLIVAVIIAVIVAGAMLSSGEVSPEKERQQQLAVLLEKADKLISLDRYYDENATGALGVYQQILVRDPENSAAKNGIKIVGQYYLLQAQQYLNDGDFSQARVSMEIVNGIDPGFPGLKIAEKRLDEILSSDKKNLQIDLLLSRADAAMKKGFVYEPDKKAALFYYQNVLSLSPNNVTAKSGLLDIVDILIARAQSALNRGDLKQAESKVSLAESIDPDNSAIRELRHKINNTSRLDNVLTKADAAFANKYYTTPKNKNSYDLYKQALTIAPANRRAKQQLDKIAAYYAGKSRVHTQSGNMLSAQKYLEILETFFPDNPDISSLKQEIRIKRTQIDASKKAREKQLAQPQIDASKKARERQLNSIQINVSKKTREKKLNPAEIDNAAISREK
jgi:serine/threonine protein kinase/tetratricopeptide (TPR) repeat protein